MFYMTNSERLFKAARTGQYPARTTAQKLMACNAPHLDAYGEDHIGYTALHAASEHGTINKIPGGVTVAQLIACKETNGSTALHYLAHNGYLILINGGVTKKELRSARDNYGFMAWTLARRMILDQLYIERGTFGNLEYPFREKVANNIIGCPDLADFLNLETYEDQEVLKVILKHPGLTTEIRNQLAKNPKLCAAML
jgi:hypothetical protein